MKRYTLTIPPTGESVRFIVRDGEAFDFGLARGAARLGYPGIPWRKENFHMCKEVTLASKFNPKTGGRAIVNAIVSEP